MESRSTLIKAVVDLKTVVVLKKKKGERKMKRKATETSAPKITCRYKDRMGW
jgi:hypothetical protein